MELSIITAIINNRIKRFFEEEFETDSEDGIYDGGYICGPAAKKYLESRLVDNGNGIKISSKYIEFIPQRMKELKQENPGLSSSTYMSLAIKNWNSIREKKQRMISHIWHGILAFDFKNNTISMVENGICYKIKIVMPIKILCPVNDKSFLDKVMATYEKELLFKICSWKKLSEIFFIEDIFLLVMKIFYLII